MRCVNLQGTVIPTLDLASAYVDEGGFYGGIFC